MLFEKVVELYLEDKRNGRKPLRLNTLEGYESAIRTHLMPRWAGMELEGICYASVQSWVDGIEQPYQDIRWPAAWYGQP